MITRDIKTCKSILITFSGKILTPVPGEQHQRATQAENHPLRQQRDQVIAVIGQLA